MISYNDPQGIPTNSLDNSKLEAAIRLKLQKPSFQANNQFIESLLSSSLIVLTSEFIHNGIDAFDQEGCFTLSNSDNIPLVTFKDSGNNKVFPVFTNVSYAEGLPYFEGFIPLIVSAISVLEMAQAMDCDKLILNFESSEMVEFDEVLLDSLSFKLIVSGELSQQPTYISV